MKCLAVLAVIVVAAPGRAQSCPAADTTIGSDITKKGWARGYDKMTDSSQLAVFKVQTKMMSGGNDFHITVVTGFEGETPKAAPQSFLKLETEIMGEGGSIMGKVNGQQLTKDNAKYRDVQTAFLLIDDSIRTKLPIVSTNAELKKAGALLPDRLQETMIFSVTPEQLLQMAKARDRIDIQAGTAKVDLRSKEIRGIRELYRFVACNPGPS